MGFPVTIQTRFGAFSAGLSYQPHSAWQAHPRRDRQEHAGYYCDYLNTLDYATSCRNITKKSAGA